MPPKRKKKKPAPPWKLSLQFLSPTKLKEIGENLRFPRLFVSIVIVGILGFLTYIVTLSDFRTLVENDPSFVFLATAILLTAFTAPFAIYILFRPLRYHPSFFRNLSLTILSILMIGWLSYGIYQISQNKLRGDDIIIVVADFYGPEQDNYQVTLDMIGKMNIALDKYSIDDTKVEALGQAITEANGGSELARRAGKKKSADLVIWGRYTIDANDGFLDIYVENLSELEFLPLEDSTFAEDYKIGKRDKLEFRQELSQEMSAFTLFISALGHYENKNFSVAYSRLGLALGQNQWNEQIISKKYPLLYRALSRFGINPEDSQNLGLTDEDRFQSGVNDIQLALEISPDDPILYFDLAWMYMIHGYSEQAIESYEKVLVYEPENLDALHNLGLTYYSTGRFDDAKDALVSVVQHDPGYVMAWHHLGNVYEALGNQDDALESYTRALEANPYYPAALNDRGLLYGNLRQFEEAERDFNMLIRVESSEPLVYFNRSKLYSDWNKYSKAIDDLNTAIQLDQKSCSKPIAECITSLALYDRARAYWGLGDTDSAMRDFDQLITLDAQNADAHWQRGALFDSTGDTTSAIKDYDAAITINPTHVPALYNRGSTKARLGDFDGAIIDLTKAIENGPEFAPAYYNRGIAYSDAGQIDLAVLDLRKVIEFNSDPDMVQAAKMKLQELGVNP